MLHALLLAAALSTSPNPTPFADATVPISAQQAAVGANNAATPQDTQVAQGAPIVQPASDPTAPNTSLPQTGVGWLFNKMGSTAVSELGPIMDMSIATAQYIFRYVAAISLIINLLSMVGSGQDLASIILGAFRRIVEWSFLLLLIMTTWSTPGGGPGWFPAIVGGIINIGIQVAQQVAPAGTPLPAQLNGTLNSLATYPGTVADLGARLYSNINASAPPDNYWANVPVLGVPAAITSGAIHLGYWIAAVYAYANCLYVALRYFFMFLRALMVGIFQFLQGMNASRRLSGFGSGLYTAPIVVGCEFAAATILVGLAMLLVEQLSYTYRLCSTLGVDPTGGGCGLLAQNLPSNALATIGDLVELGAVLTAWTYAMRTIPTWVADTIAGKISVNMQELSQHFAASPMPGSGYIGSGMNIVSSTAEGGVGAGAKTAWESTPIAGMGRSAIVGVVAGATGSALKGAIGGFLMGGPEGAVVGAVAGAVTGAMGGGDKKDESSSSEEQDPSTVEAGDNPTQRADEAEMNSDDETAEAAMHGGGTVRSGGAAEASPSPFSSETPMGSGAAPVNENSVRSGAANTGVPGGTTGSNRTVTDTTNVQEQVNRTGDASASDGASAQDTTKTATQTTNVKQASSAASAEDVMKALQGLSAALNANTTAMQSGGKSGGGSAGGGGADGASESAGSGGGRSTLGGMAREMNMDMSIGGMLMRQALYRQARTPTPPAPPPHEDSTSIGGLTIGSHA